MKQQAVIGAGFGDEGKGKVVSYLCSKSEAPLVLRFSGGHQAGHQVVLGPEPNQRHVFSNFGSGTLQRCPTFWTRSCTVDPVGFMNELEVLQGKGINPEIYIDADCPVTTPYEKSRNRSHDALTSHGTCGVGVGQTWQREEDHHSITFSDLFFPRVLEMKLNLLAKYYGCIREPPGVQDFFNAASEMANSRGVLLGHWLPDNFMRDSDLIFEGSQGLLLDQSYGFFPHVTRSNCGAQNIVKMGANPKIFLVTRAYQTRHGNGPMTNEGLTCRVKKNPYEVNTYNQYQGEFRKTALDLDLLLYAISKDVYIRCHRDNIVVTCLDDMAVFELTYRGRVIEFKTAPEFVRFIQTTLGFKHAFAGTSPGPELEQLV